MIKKIGVRPLVGILFFVLILLLVGVLLRVKFSSLFENYVENRWLSKRKVMPLRQANGLILN